MFVCENLICNWPCLSLQSIDERTHTLTDTNTGQPLRTFCTIKSTFIQYHTCNLWITQMVRVIESHRCLLLLCFIVWCERELWWCLFSYIVHKLQNITNIAALPCAWSIRARPWTIPNFQYSNHGISCDILGPTLKGTVSHTYVTKYCTSELFSVHERKISCFENTFRLYIFASALIAMVLNKLINFLKITFDISMW